MSIRNLDALFGPRSIAVIGASNRARSVGAAVMRNLLEGGFDGPIMPVNPNRRAVAGVLAYPDVGSLPVAPELAVIATPAPSVPDLVAELARRGARAAVVLSAGLDREAATGGSTLERAMLEAARPNAMRILGPNCLGLLVPASGLNASFAHIGARPGNVALVHQSGALCTALLDWAASCDIGFSHFVSLGDGADVDFADIVDYLGGEASARAILMYVESIGNARKFMSATRAAARNKPVLLIKAGRASEGSRAATSHTGALAASDDICDAAFRRAGMLRVYDTSEMFDAVETLSRSQRIAGERLGILTNGGGPGVIATDALVLGGGRLASLEADTLAKLDEVLPSTWSRGNPIDIIGDATGERYARALEVVLDDAGVDAVLVLHAPTAIASSREVAHAVVEVVQRLKRSHRVLACWLGGDTMGPARRLLSESGIPVYETPESAVRAFMHVVRYRRNQELLMETPPSVPAEFEAATASARLVVDNALASGRTALSEPESKLVLAAYGIPVVETRIAGNPQEAEQIAGQVGFPVALKMLSAQISHKSDVGGVVLDLGSGEAVREAATALQARVAALRPDATVRGFTVQPMARRPRAHELIVGTATDAVFGPVILFGEGGTAAEVIGDRAVALPPLNLHLARELVGRTRISSRLAGYRDRPPVHMDALLRVLLQVSQLVTDIAEIAELDINPLFADEEGVLALDARIALRATPLAGPARLAIRPYPSELEDRVTLGDEAAVLRPIRPEDEPAHRAFLLSLDPQDVRFRFFGAVRDFPHSQLARFTQIDYDREMAFIATVTRQEQPVTLGVVRAVTDADNRVSEFAIVVDSNFKGRGLGRMLLQKIIDYCRARGTSELRGEVLRENKAMLGLAKRLGFETFPLEDATVVGVRLMLQTAPGRGRSNER